MIPLSNLPVDFLIEEKISLMQRIAKMKEPVLYPPVGYRFNFSLMRHLEERLDEINNVLAHRADQDRRMEAVGEFASSLPDDVAQYLVRNNRIK